MDGLYAPRRTVLDPILADAAVAAGAEIRFDTIVVDVVRDPSGRVSGVSYRDRDGQVRTAEADLVIGADGIGSTVARRVGAPTSHSGRASTAALYAYLPSPGVTGYEWIYSLTASSGAIPTNDGMICLTLSVATSRFDAEVRQDPHGSPLEILGELDPRTSTPPGSARMGSDPSVDGRASCARHRVTAGRSSGMLDSSAIH